MFIMVPIRSTLQPFVLYNAWPAMVMEQLQCIAFSTSNVTSHNRRWTLALVFEYGVASLKVQSAFRRLISSGEHRSQSCSVEQGQIPRKNSPTPELTSTFDSEAQNPSPISTKAHCCRCNWRTQYVIS